MAKVLGIVGSHRRQGNSAVLAQLCLEAVNKSGFEVELIRLHDLNIKSCRGCLSCVYKGKCAIEDDDMPALLEKLVNASGLVTAAPTYIFSPSAVIKTLIDRSLMLTPYLEELKEKKRFAVSISIAGSARWNPMGTTFLNQFALSYGYKVLDQMEAYGPGPAETVLQVEAVEKAARMGELLAQTLRGEHVPPKHEMSGLKCPVCMGSVFDLKKAGKAQCVACLAEGVPVQSSEGFEIAFVTPEHNFFYIDDRIEHVKDWIEPSRDRFFEVRERIKARLDELGIKKR
ncbi:MAG: flavodoxin family protein [Peptococcaceae bacterium]|jgi:multimeric flavodoxin WrbA|nr:flavodoxin family protein [Peptococcaceae bacterium]MDH7524382.1 flavodoxin family protein [Peptococcaceae bacterium]